MTFPPGFWGLSASRASGCMPDRRAEDRVPPGGADPEPSFLVFEMVTHMQLVQPSTDAPAWPRVVKGVMKHVVAQIADEESCCHAPRVRKPHNDHKKGRKTESERHSHDRRHHKPSWVVRMIVMDAMADPMHPDTEVARRLEMEQLSMRPVLAQSPEPVTRQNRDRQRHGCQRFERLYRATRDHRPKDSDRNDRMNPSQPVKPPRRKQRRRGTQQFSAI